MAWISTPSKPHSLATVSYTHLDVYKRQALDRRERLFCMVAYCPKATVQAAIGSIPLSMGLACGNLVLLSLIHI